MTDLELTAEQQALVDQADGPLVVYSGPGTGKTEVILRRVSALVLGRAEESFRVLILTYTRSACAAMAQRLKALNVPVGERAVVRTLHAFALDVLRNYGSRVSVGRDPVIYEGKRDRTAALRDALAAITTTPLADSDLQAVLALLDDAWTKEDPEEYLARTAATWGGRPVSELAAAYLNHLRETGALDFDVLLWRAIELFEAHPAVAAHYRGIYRYVMVDEAQDLTAAQFRFLNAFAGGEHRNFFLAADPAQSIYGFRGASIANLREFADRLGAPWYDLEVNHRCGFEIARVAAPLLRLSAPVRTRSAEGIGAPGHVSALSYGTEEAQAEGVVEWITDLLEKGVPAEWTGTANKRVPSEEIGVLGRNRSHLAAVAEALDEAGVPFYFTGGERGVMDSTPYRAAYQAMRVLASPEDRAVRRALLDEAGLSHLGEAILNGTSKDFLVAVARLSPPHLTVHIQWAAAADRPEQEKVFPALTTMDEPPSLAEGESELYQADQQFLARRWEKYLNLTDPVQRSWSSLLLALAGDPREDPGGVRVLTAHAAKGREFTAVAIVGMNDGMLPDFRSVDTQEDLDAERRLTYVAVTRASVELFLTRPRTRRTRFGPRSQTPSRFLAEMEIDMANV